MAIRKVFQVRPNQLGCLFYKNQLQKKLPPGIYRFWDWWDEYALLPISTYPRVVFTKNQEVLTKDNIALRFSYVLAYNVADVQKLLDHSNIESALTYRTGDFLFSLVEDKLNYLIRVRSRELISNIDSEELNLKRAEFNNLITPEIVEVAINMGLQLNTAYILDLTFPKNIQDLLAKQLESKIRAKVDLENARTAVATARALKNASDLMKGDQNIRFLQLLETLTKIAAKGNHTFVLGELEPLKKDPKEFL